MSVSRTGTTPTPFGFVGAAQYQTDADSGLQLLGNRYYDSSIGRFISRDPAHAGMNWFAYCYNNPLTGIDPMGLDVGWGDIGRELLNPGNWGRGIGTGLAAVGSDLNLGYWDGGRWKNDPGFGTSKTIGYVGIAAGIGAGVAAGAPVLIGKGLLTDGPAICYSGTIDGTPIWQNLIPWKNLVGGQVIGDTLVGKGIDLIGKVLPASITGWLWEKASAIFVKVNPAPIFTVIGDKPGKVWTTIEKPIIDLILKATKKLYP